jgi:hypothetical protein
MVDAGTGALGIRFLTGQKRPYRLAKNLPELTD